MTSTYRRQQQAEHRAQERAEAEGRERQQRAVSQVMNQAIVAMAGRGQHSTGAVARFSGAPLRERLSDALDKLEAAKRSGDETAIRIHETAVDRIVEEARAAIAQRPRNPDGTFASADHGETPAASFDGGRSLRPIPAPGGRAQEESAAQLMARAMLRSRQERSESGQEQALVAANI